jgi:hypothetical protein
MHSYLNRKAKKRTKSMLRRACTSLLPYEKKNK